MAQTDENEIKEIVRRVIAQAIGQSTQAQTPPNPVSPPAPALKAEAHLAERKVVAIGADHGGYELKELLKPDITALGYDVADVGTTGSKEAVDYPDFAHAVALLVSTGKAWRGIVIDGAGIGSCIVANKVPGVRAGMAYDYSTAVNGREHNDTNVLTLGAGLVGVALAKTILKTWLTTEFGGGRHAKRVGKIIEYEKHHLK